jgi:hypothetical protein
MRNTDDSLRRTRADRFKLPNRKMPFTRYKLQVIIILILADNGIGVDRIPTNNLQ